MAKNNLGEYVKLLGRLDNETLKLLYNTADVFVMPNIPVEGDIEGFGIVVTGGFILWRTCCGFEFGKDKGCCC